MESSPQPEASEQAVAGILARAEQTFAAAGERILVEWLHRTLDDKGSAALIPLSGTLLPLLQAIVIVLPRAMTDGASPAVLAAARTLGAAAHEQGIVLPDLLTEGLRVHDRLLREVAADLRAADTALVLAVLQISRALLDVGREILLAYQEGSAAPPEHGGAASGSLDQTRPPTAEHDAAMPE